MSIELCRHLTAHLPRVRGAGKITALMASHTKFESPAWRSTRWQGASLTLDISQEHERFMFFSPQLYEWRVADALRGAIRPGATYLDIGANIGIFTVLGSRLTGPRGKVIGIEADPKTFAQLRSNVETNKLANVKLINLAVSDEAGTARLYRNDFSNSGANALAADGSANVDPSDSVSVPTEMLDAVLDQLNIGRVDVVKLDIEGWELRALGNSRLLTQTPKPIIITEVNDQWLRRAGSSASEFRSLLVNAGFSEQYITHQDRLFS